MTPGAELVGITVYGPDPLGEELWDSLARQTAAELSGSGAPQCVRVGMKGSDTMTYYGDPGPLQQYPTSFAARNAFVPPPNQALPGATSPLAPSGLRGLVAEFGL